MSQTIVKEKSKDPKSLKELGRRPLRIEILECKGGEGHLTCSNAIQSAIVGHFVKKNITVEFTRTDVGASMAPKILQQISFIKSENARMIEVHNFLARNGFTHIIYLFMHLGKVFHRFNLPFATRFFKKHLKDLQPDLVISTVPLLNAPLIKAAKDWNIPVLVITTIPDHVLFSINWPRKDESAPHRYCIPYNSLEVAANIHREIETASIRSIGFPVRGEFCKEYSQSELAKFRQELEIPQQKQCVGIMMGGLGSAVLERYFDHMIQGMQPGMNLHFIFFCGHNHRVRDKILSKARKAGFNDNLEHEYGVSLSVIGFADEVYKYMAISDCWVTKPGSSSFNEALCMAVPVLLDETRAAMPWEELNIDLAETFGFGQRVIDLDQFMSQLQFVLNGENNCKYHAAMRSYRKDRQAQGNFDENLVQLVDELLNEAKRKKRSGAHKKKKESHPSPGRNRTFFENLYNYIEDLYLFSGFYLRKELRQKVRRRLMGGDLKSIHSVKPIEGVERPLLSSISKQPIDAIYIESFASRRSGMTVLLVLDKAYQRYPDSFFDQYLDEGSDVVLFNPTENKTETMKWDLKTLFDEVKRRKPTQKLTVVGKGFATKIVDCL